MLNHQFQRRTISSGAAGGCASWREPENSRRLTSADSSTTPRGSASESAACLDAMVAKGFFDAEIQDGQAMLIRIVSMLFGLIRANSDVRVFEEQATYRFGKKQE
jgi:hypothetical protein